MNKKDATKVAGEIWKYGHACKVRQFGRHWWAVEVHIQKGNIIDTSTLFHSIDTYEAWKAEAKNHASGVK